LTSAPPTIAKPVNWKTDKGFFIGVAVSPITLFVFSSELFVIHILLLSSFQTFAEELRITTADVSTPENTDKTIELTLNKGNTEPSKYKRTFAILGGADSMCITNSLIIFMVNPPNN
jgi:hypothetical protein